MRLIDADELKSLPWINDRGVHDSGEEFVYLSAIDRSPSIEAIPVVWLEKKLGELIAQGHTLMASYFAEVISMWRDEND